jgi:exosortase
MIPLPFSIEVALQRPLRTFGTVTSTYIMQTIGLPALAEGNVIVVRDYRIGVEEACSGLRMLMIFFALSTAVALISERPLWERIVIVASAVPIALVTNIMRITVTGIFYLTGNEKLADLVFHDLAGWLMMPFALGLLWVELWVLSRLFVEEEQRPLVAGLQTE